MNRSFPAGWCDRSLRRCEKIGSAVRAAGQTACPTVQPGHLARRGAGGFACPPFSSRLLTVAARKPVPSHARKQVVAPTVI